jgi:hypothetical protein
MSMTACFNVLGCCPDICVSHHLYNYLLCQDTYTHTLLSGVYKDNFEDSMKAAQECYCARHLARVDASHPLGAGS